MDKNWYMILFSKLKKCEVYLGIQEYEYKRVFNCVCECVCEVLALTNKKEDFQCVEMSKSAPYWIDGGLEFLCLKEEQSSNV